MSRKGMFLDMETFHNQCTMYQTHQFHLFYVPTNLPRFLLIFLRLCPLSAIFVPINHKSLFLTSNLLLLF